MPEEGEKYLHIPVRDSGLFVSDSLRTTTISSTKGIKAVVGKLKSDAQGSTSIQKYMFLKSKWSMADAKAWVKEHTKSFYSDFDMALRNFLSKEDNNYKFRIPCLIEKALGTDDVPDGIDPEEFSKYLGVFKATVSTSALDSDRDIITWKAIEQGANQLNQRGIVLFNHNRYDPPIGRFIKAWAVKKGINEYGVETGEIQGYIGISKTAQDIWTLIDEGILIEMSVGGVLDWGGAEEFYNDDDEFDYRLIHSWELFEASVVNIAANPEARISVVLGKMMSDIAKQQGETNLVDETEGKTPQESEDPEEGGDDEEEVDVFSEIEDQLGERLSALRDEILEAVNEKIEETNTQARSSLEELQAETTQTLNEFGNGVENVTNLLEFLMEQQGVELEEGESEGDDQNSED